MDAQLVAGRFQQAMRSLPAAAYHGFSFAAAAAAAAPGLGGFHAAAHPYDFPSPSSIVSSASPSALSAFTNSYHHHQQAAEKAGKHTDNISSPKRGGENNNIHLKDIDSGEWGD